jgi:DNA helicase TIP49 (TBP-interacting protein)
MALLGPVGSGKTALVYAAAQELGFGVLEVNPSMERTAGQVSCTAGLLG